MVIRRLKNIGHLILAIAANIYYGFPSRRVTVIGVTGTDGKTTTAHLLYHILKSCGKKVSMVSTIGAKIGDLNITTGLHTTTPNSFFIQRLLQKSVEQGDEFFVLEVTSHAIDQNRIFGIKVHLGILTNITPEHLDYHKNYSSYLKTKCSLLLFLDISIINKDDGSFPQVKSLLETFQKTWIPYGIDPKIRSRALYERYNYSAAVLASTKLGVEYACALDALKTFQRPEGRLDIIRDGNRKVIVDFAHTPNAISSVLKYVRLHEVKKPGKLIHVFGAAGLRDSQKRPFMGENSSLFSDLVILTEEDYRTENPVMIAEQIAEGLKKNHWCYIPKGHLSTSEKANQYTIITDRNEAIEKAMSIAGPRDVIVITGKGHEQSLCRGKEEYPWSDKKAVNQFLNKNEI